MKKSSVILIILLTVTALALLIVLTVTLSDGESDSNIFDSESFLSLDREAKISSPRISNPCPHFQKRVLFAHRGGNLTNHQENTLEVFLDSVVNNRAIEMDLMQVASGEIIAFHDKNALLKTGINFDIHVSSWEKVQNLTYLSSYDNRNYSSNPKIPLLKDALNTICTVDNRTSIWFDIKYSFDNEFIISLLDHLDNSPCACDAEQKIVFEVYKDLNAVKRFKNLMSNRRCQLLAAMSLYDFQSELGFNFLKNQIGKYAGLAEIVDFPSAMALQFPELLEINYDNKICNSVYGDNNKDIELVALNPYLDLVIYNFYE